MKKTIKSDYKDCVNRDEITVPLQLRVVLFYDFSHQHRAYFAAPPPHPPPLQMISVNTGINTLGRNFSQCKMTKPFQAALEIHTR